MAAPANGIYIFTNVEYPDSSLDLFRDTQFGPITGKTVLPGVPPREWNLLNVGPGQITIRNANVPGPVSFVSVAGQPPQPAEGIGLAGAADAFNWIPAQIPGTVNTWSFGAVDADGDTLYLTLTGDSNNAAVVLQPAGPVIPPAAPPAAQWTLN